jgi:hypothetical protein
MNSSLRSLAIGLVYWVHTATSLSRADFMQWQQSFGKEAEYARLDSAELDRRFAGSSLPPRGHPPHVNPAHSQYSRQTWLSLRCTTRATSLSRSP